MRYKKCSKKLCVFSVSAILFFTFTVWQMLGESSIVQTVVDSRTPTAPEPKVFQYANSSAYRLLVTSPIRRFQNGQTHDVAIIVDTNSSTTGRTDLKPKVIYLATTFHGNGYLDHHYSPQPDRQSFQNYGCPYSNCIVTRDPKDLPKADAVLFHLRDLNIPYFPDFRSPSQKWILYTMEPPWLDIFDMDKLDGFFNWTMGYRLDSDIVVKYGFVLETGENTKVKGHQMLMSKKTNMAVWFVSDCCTQSNREEYVKELRKHIEVDVFGGCGKKPCLPAESKDCYDNLLPRYMFYLSFENALCKDYVTEKFFNALDQDIIPVVFGGADYASLAPPGSYIDATNFANPRHLADYMKVVAHNETLYSSFFKWKNNYTVFLHAWPCDLCAKLNQDLNSTTVHTQLRLWWEEEAACRTWTQNGISRKLSPTLPCYRRKIFE